MGCSDGMHMKFVTTVRCVSGSRRAKVLVFALGALALAACAPSRDGRDSGMAGGAVGVPFAGRSFSPSGGGVDLSLHNARVNRNPNGNPLLAWDSPHVFTVMAHGVESSLGPCLLDESSGGDAYLTPEALLRRIERDPRLRSEWSRSDTVVLYACRSGGQSRSGLPSFASRFARLAGKPVVAPSAKLFMRGGAGSIPGGTFRRLEP